MLDLGWALHPITSVLEKVEGALRPRDAQRGRPCKDGGKDLSDVLLSQGTSRIAGNHQKLGERHGMDSHSEPPEATNPERRLDFELPASCTMGE